MVLLWEYEQHTPIALAAQREARPQGGDAAIPEERAGIQVRCTEIEQLNSPLIESKIMQVTITENPSHGQLYIETGDGSQVRVPTEKVDGFMSAVCDRVGSFIVPGSFKGSDAADIWAIAQEFEG